MREIGARLIAIALTAQFSGALTSLATAEEPGKPAGFSGAFKAYAPGNVEVRLSDFSGLPVPRYSSLRYDKVNGRAGPSLDYPVEWAYQRQGLPVVIVRESQEWRKIRDPLGDEVWVNKSQLAGERTAMATEAGSIRRQPDPAAAVIATYASGAVVVLGPCEAGWCRVEAEDRKGWAPQAQLWGAGDLGAGAPGG